MILLILISAVGAVYAGGLMLTLVAVERAPEGYEDADGFHLGPKPARARSLDCAATSNDEAESGLFVASASR